MPSDSNQSTNANPEAISQAGRMFKEHIEADTGLPIHLNASVANRTFDAALEQPEINSASDADAIFAAARNLYQQQHSLYRRDVRNTPNSAPEAADDGEQANPPT